MSPSFNKHDYLAIGCYGWGRSSSARRAFELMKFNASPKLVKPEYRNARILRLADVVDEVSVSELGWFRIEKFVDGHVRDKYAIYATEVWCGPFNIASTKIPSTFDAANLTSP